MVYPNLLYLFVFFCCWFSFHSYPCHYLKTSKIPIPQKHHFSNPYNFLLFDVSELSLISIKPSSSFFLLSSKLYLIGRASFSDFKTKNWAPLVLSKNIWCLQDPHKKSIRDDKICRFPEFIWKSRVPSSLISDSLFNDPGVGKRGERKIPHLVDFALFFNQKVSDQSVFPFLTLSIIDNSSGGCCQSHLQMGFFGIQRLKDKCSLIAKSENFRW